MLNQMRNLANLLNPFRGLPNQREVFAWTMYDAASQSFTLIINSVLFGVFFKRVVMAGSADADRAWSLMIAVSLLAVCVLAPILGTIADEKGLRKPFLMFSCVVCSACTFFLGFVGPGNEGWTAALYMPANFAYAMSNVFLSAFLPQVATPATMGRVSAIGWGSGYVSSLVMLGLAAGCMVAFDWEEPARWGPLIAGAGVWYLLLAIPTMVGLFEKRTPPQFPPGTNLVLVAVRRLGQTVREASRFRQLLVFLSVFFLYNLGVQTVVYFSAIIADDFGIEGSRLVLFMLPVSLCAGIGAVLTGLYQDRIGNRRTVMIWLAVWVVTSLAFIFVPHPPGPGERSPLEWVLWVASSAIGLGLGGIGTAGRAMVGAFTPASKTSEFFGLWGLSYKLAALVGAGGFGIVKTQYGNTIAFSVLSAVFVLGFGLMLLVDERAGIAAAQEPAGPGDKV
ncbi:MAG: MFS transporter [Phycisphaerales bacterium]